MRFPFHLTALWLALALAFSVAGCAQDEPAAQMNFEPADFPGAGLGKTDVFGRELVGVAAPYNADLALRGQKDLLASDMGYRREVAWAVVSRVLDSVPMLGLAELVEGEAALELPGGETPQVPRWQTWYGVEDFKRIFRHVYGELTPEERILRAPFSEEALDAAFQWNATAMDRSERWPLERFLKHVQTLGVCDPNLSDDECARTLQSNFSGAAAGNTRITYSPGTMEHLLANYGALLDCVEGLKTLPVNQASDNEDENFTFCLGEEFPADAVLMKAHWVRSDFGRKMPAFDTDGDTLRKVTGPAASANWAEGDREVDPEPDEIYTIRLRNGDTYRLAGLHVMTKELRHWVWITLWWSDKPNEDFGADRPNSIQLLDPVWSHYKMGVVVDYREQDPNPAARFADLPSLADALEAVRSEETWLSNPYIEHGRGNARTNCVGCHQHGGSTVGYDLDDNGTLDPFDLESVIDNEILFPGNGRTQIRSTFPADYLWSTQRVDKLQQVLLSEVSNFDIQDKLDPSLRALAVLQLEDDSSEGALVFAENCTPCHGPEGKGTDTAPALYDRVPTLSETGLVERLILGKGAMPSWSHFSDQELADLRAYLRVTFDL